MADDQIRVGSQSEGGPNYSLHYHTPLGFLITVLWVTIQTKYQGRKESPFDTHPFASVTFIVVFSLYALMLIMAEIIIRLRVTTLPQIFSDICLIFGSLASVLLLYIVVPIVGWIAFFVWLILMAMVAWKIYQEHHQLLKDTT